MSAEVGTGVDDLVMQSKTHGVKFLLNRVEQLQDQVARLLVNVDRLETMRLRQSDRIDRLERKTDAIDEAQSMKLCQVREELDRLQGHSDGEQPTETSTTSDSGSTCESGEPERIRFEDIQKDMAEYHKTLREK